jgi:hypothetical protein
MEVEAWEVQIGLLPHKMKCAQPASTPLQEVGSNPSRVIVQKQASQPLVTKALDHERGDAVVSRL